MSRPSLSTINLALSKFNEAQRNTAPSSATDEGGNALGGPMPERPLLTQEQYNAMTDEQLWALVSEASGGMSNSYYYGGGNRMSLADDDPLAQEFATKFGSKGFANAEMNNQKLTGLIHGKGDIKLYGKDAAEWMQDPSRIMYLPDGSWVIEAGNLKGDVLANLQSADDSSGIGDSDAFLRAGLGLVLGGGMLGNSMMGGGWEGLGVGDGMTPPGGWDADTIANVLGPNGGTPGVGTVSTDGNWALPGSDTLPVGADNAPSSFDQWLESYLSDSGSTTQLPFGEEAYADLGIDPNAVSAAGAFEGMEAPSWLDRIMGAGSSLIDRLPSLANALKYAIPQGGGATGGKPSLGGVGGGGGGIGGGGGRGIASDPFEAEKLKKILTLSEYLGGLK